MCRRFAMLFDWLLKPLQASFFMFRNNIENQTLKLLETISFFLKVVHKILCLTLK